jgi:hypothetical protein
MGDPQTAAPTSREIMKRAHRACVTALLLSQGRVSQSLDKLTVRRTGIGAIWGLLSRGDGLE